MKLKKLICAFFISITFMNNSFSNNDSFGFVVRGYNAYDAPISVSFSGDSYQMILRGDTRDEDMKGVGVFEGSMVPDVLSALHLKLNNTPLDEGRFASTTLVDKYIKSFFSNGLRRCKLDARIDVKLHRDGGLLVTIQFINSGGQKIVFENPKKWEGETNRILGDSNIPILGKRFESFQSDDDMFLIDNIGGKQLLNLNEVGQGNFEVESGETRTVEFIAFPDKPIKKGEYGTAATISIKKIIEPLLLKGTVEFSSLSSRVVFSHDYPSTPEEIKAFSAYLKSQERQ